MEEADGTLEKQNTSDVLVTTIFENYGWYILVGAVILMYVYRKLQPVIEAYLKDKEDREYAAKYHKDPDLAVTRIVAQQAAAQKLQDKYAKDAQVYQAKVEEKETKKREEWLAKQGLSSGHVLGDGSTKSEQKTFKPGYNPLTGDSSSRSYRPPRRSPCSGGGCGR